MVVSGKFAVVNSSDITYALNQSTVFDGVVAGVETDLDGVEYEFHVHADDVAAAVEVGRTFLERCRFGRRRRLRDVRNLIAGSGHVSYS